MDTGRREINGAFRGSVRFVFLAKINTGVHAEYCSSEVYKRYARTSIETPLHRPKTHTHTHTHTHTCTHIHIYTRMHTSHTHTYTLTHTRMHALNASEQNCNVYCSKV